MRKPNGTKPTRPGIVLWFLPHELRFLRKNLRGPSGLMGGYQRLENWLLDHTDPKADGRCELDAERLERLIRYIQCYGSGGPNGRLRDACIPALRRVGVDLLAQWRAA